MQSAPLSPQPHAACSLLASSEPPGHHVGRGDGEGAAAGLCGHGSGQVGLPGAWSPEKQDAPRGPPSWEWQENAYRLN